MPLPFFVMPDNVNTRSGHGDGDVVIDDPSVSRFGESAFPYDAYNEAVNVVEDNDPISQFFNWITGKTAQSREYLQQRNLQELEFEQQKQLQQGEMEYNSEVAKIERMKEAGLNVNLLSGAASSSVGSSHVGSVASPNHVSSPIPSIGAGLDSIMNSVESFNKVGQIKANERNLDADTILKGIMAGLMPMESAAQIALWESQTAEYVSKSLLNEANANWVNDQAKFFASTIDVRAEQLRQDLLTAKAQCRKIVEETNNIIAERKNIAKQGNVLDAQATLYRAESVTEEVKQDLYREQTQYVDWQGDIEKLRYEQIRDVFGGLPYGVDWSNVVALYATGKEEDKKQADSMLDALCSAYAAQYNQQISSAAEHYWTNLGMRAGNSIVDGMQYLPFMFLKGMGKPYQPYQGWNPTFTNP